MLREGAIEDAVVVVVVVEEAKPMLVIQRRPDPALTVLPVTLGAVVFEDDAATVNNVEDVDAEVAVSPLFVGGKSLTVVADHPPGDVDRLVGVLRRQAVDLDHLLRDPVGM